MYRNKVVMSDTNDRRYARCYDTETARHFHPEFIAGQFRKRCCRVLVGVCLRTPMSGMTTVQDRESFKILY